MPTLNELREKWFLKFDGSDDLFPPAVRRTNSTISNYSDNNQVTAFIDGSDYMAQWHQTLNELANTPGGGELYHSAWRLENVSTLGISAPYSRALTMILYGRQNNIVDYGLYSAHILCFKQNWSSAAFLNKSLPTEKHLIDKRFPKWASLHQKYSVFKHANLPNSAMLGSIDMSYTRWDESIHDPDIPEQETWFGGGPTHDLGVQIIGPSAVDIEKAFRERYNDTARLETNYTDIDSPIANPQPVAGSNHSVQVLETFGRTDKPEDGYSWSQDGEFTLWAAYINALKKATDYIYIEDQYFLPFGYPPFIWNEPGVSDNTNESDIIWQLGEAIKRGVKVMVVTPSNTEDVSHVYQTFQRNLGIKYLYDVALNSPGDIVVSSLHKRSASENHAIYVHSKLLICDDEFVLVGSGNVCLRSMACDGELSVGIVDGDGNFARDLRVKLMREHMANNSLSLDDTDVSFATFFEYSYNYETYWLNNDDTAGSRLRPYALHNNPDFNEPGFTLHESPVGEVLFPDLSTASRITSHAYAYNIIIDPYYGPDY